MRSFQTILAIDSAMNGCGAGVYAGGQCVARSVPMVSGQSEHLVPLVERVMSEAQIDYPALQAIVVTVGPGAFTGVRIGISTARSFGLALGIPVYGMTTLQALALQCAQAGNVPGDLAVLVETKREDFYIQTFGPQAQASSEPEALDASAIAARLAGRAITLAGDAVARFKTLAGAGEPGWHSAEGPMLPDPAVLALTLATGGAKSPFMVEGSAPVYLRAPDVSQSKKKQRVLAQ